MKAIEFLTLLGELDEGVLAQTLNVPVTARKKRRILWVAAAACFCACLLGFSAWFFVPPQGAFSNNLRMTVIRVDDRLISYEIINLKRLSHYERALLPDELGEVLVTHGDCTFYRAEGENDLVYLLEVDGEGNQFVLRFLDYVFTAGHDMTTSYWYTSGWLTDEDIASLNNTSIPTMGEILETVYCVNSPEDLQSIRFKKDDACGCEVGKKIKVKSVKVKDDGALARLYGRLVSMTLADYGQPMNFGSVHVYDEAYLMGEKPLSDQVNRDLTITLTSGRKVTLTYYPNVGLLYQGGTGLYTVLSEADNAWLIDLAAIDMEWRDWGTEKALVYGEGCETAVAPSIPEAEQLTE